MKRWLLLLVLAVCIVSPAQQHLPSPIPTLDASTSATGSAPPAKVSAVGYRNSTNLVSPIICDKNASAAAAAVANTQMVALSGSTVIYVCNLTIQGTGAAGTVKVVYGTGTACATGTTTLVTPWTTAVGTTIPAFIGGGASSSVMQTAAGNALCLVMATTSATANYFVSYAQF